MASIATALILAGIFGLFWLDRDGTRISKAAWVPWLWLMIASSRPVSSWGSGSSMSRSEQYLDGSPLDRNILMLLIFFGLVVLSRRTKQARAFLGANVPIVIFLTYCLVSITWSDFPFVAFKRWIRAGADVVMVLIIVTELDWKGSIQRLITRLAYVLVPVSLLFVKFYPDLGRAYSFGGSPMWTGVCTDKNALGALCMMCGVVLLWRATAVLSDRELPDRGRQLLCMGVVFGMIIYLLSIIDSKTALVCFVLASTVVAFRRLFQVPVMVFGFVVSAVIASYLAVNYGIDGGAMEALGRNDTLTGRTQIWQAVLLFVQDPWLGTGYESFWMGERLLALQRMGGNQAHNGYLEIYLNLGWIGLTLLMAMILTGYRNMVSEIRTEPQLTRLKVAFFLICLIYNFTEASFKMMSPIWLMFLLATLASPKQQTSELPLRPRAAVAIRPNGRLINVRGARIRQGA